MKKNEPSSGQLHELLLQALETELGGIQIYETAVRCAVNDELRDEWTEYLEQTKRHEAVLRDLFKELELDPDVNSPGRQVVGYVGRSLVAAMEMARRSGTAEAAQLVAAECVVHAETKDHLNWELLALLAAQLDGDAAEFIAEACEQVEEEEDEHLYHTQGWTRELWVESLGLPAVLPPPEEERHVKTAIGAARAKAARDTMI